MEGGRRRTPHHPQSSSSSSPATPPPQGYSEDTSRADSAWVRVERPRPPLRLRQEEELALLMVLAQWRDRMGVRSWHAFVDPAKFSVPEGVEDVAPRLQRNLVHWRGNYGLVAVVAAVLALFFNPWMLVPLLVWLGGVAGLSLLSPSHHNSGHGKTPSSSCEGGAGLGPSAPHLALTPTCVVPRSTLYIVLYAVVGLLFLLTSMNTFFWLLGLVSFLVLLHGCLRHPEVVVERSPDHLSPTNTTTEVVEDGIPQSKTHTAKEAV